VGWSADQGAVTLARSMPVAHGPVPDHDDSAPSGPPVVFVSYCREDAEWLRRFAVMLKPEVRNRPPVELWHDTLIAAGRQWRPELEDAVGRTVVALLLVTPDFLASDFIMQTELPALQAAGAVLVPVLVRACSDWAPVDALRRVQGARDPAREGPVDAPGTWAVDAAIAQTARAVAAALDARLGASAPAPATQAGRSRRMQVAAVERTTELGKHDGVPELPHGFVARDELVELRGALLGAGEGGLAITGGRGLGIHGQGGIGKTVLAAALARDEQVRSHFPDGVWWVTVGERPDLVGAQIDLLERLGAPTEGVRSTLDALGVLRDALRDQRCLVVVDDVWSAAAAQAFDATDEAGRVLYTTRDPAVLRDMRAAVHRIDVLAPAAARELLAALTATAVQDLPNSDVDRVLAATGRVARALALVAAAVGRGGRGWREVADELEVAAGTFLEHPYANVFKAMGVAVAGLDAPVAAAHETLAVFPEDTRVPVAAVARLWAHLYKLTGAQTRERLGLLASRELVALDEDAITLHDLQRDFLLLRVLSVALLHHELLCAYRTLLASPASPWRTLPHDEPYIHEHLLEHFIGAGDATAATALARDLGWLAIRAFAAGPHAAEADVRRAAALAPDDPVVAWILSQIARWGHLLTGHEHLHDLAATLWMHVSDVPSGGDTAALRQLLGTRALTPRWGLPETGGSLRVLPNAGASVMALAFSPQGAIMGAADGFGTIRLWDADGGAEMHKFAAHDGLVLALAFSPDGASLASAGADATVCVCDVAGVARPRTLEGHGDRVHAIAFSPDGEMLAGAPSIGAVCLWEIATGRRIRSLDRSGDRMFAIAFNPDGATVAGAGVDGTLRLWEASTGRLTRMIERDINRVIPLAFSPNVATVASAAADGGVCLWDVATGTRVRKLQGGGGRVLAIALSPDGATLAGAGVDGTVHLWNVATGAATQTLEGHTDFVTAVAFSHDGGTLASAGGEAIRLWDIAPVSGSPASRGRHIGRVLAVALSRDGHMLASGADDGTVWLWDTATGTAARTLEGHAASVLAVALSPDGTTLASAASDGTMRLWDAATGALACALESHSRRVLALAFSPDGATLASGAADGTVRLWDAATGVPVGTLEGHTRGVSAVAFSADGAMLASGAADRSVRLWDAATGAPIGTLEGHSRGVSAVAFSPDGVTLASGAADRRVRLWHAATGAPIGTVEDHTRGVREVAFTPDGGVLVGVGIDLTLRLWDMPSATCSVCVRLGAPVQALAAGHGAVALGLGRTVCYLATADARPPESVSRPGAVRARR
jgi:WD40 repeat protein